MVYEIPKSKASIGQNRFEFRFPDSDRVHSVPLLKYLKPSLAMQIVESSEMVGARMLLDTYLGETFEDFEDSEQLQAFMAAWQEASGIALGESQASSSS